MACKTCVEWRKENERNKEVARELSIKLAAAEEKIAVLEERIGVTAATMVQK